MTRVYEPRVGELRAHQIGMSTRIAYIFVFAYLLLDRSHGYTTSETFVAGAFWLGMILAFEWWAASSCGDRSTRSSSAGTSTAGTCGLMSCWHTSSPRSSSA